MACEVAMGIEFQTSSLLGRCSTELLLNLRGNILRWKKQNLILFLLPLGDINDRYYLLKKIRNLALKIAWHDMLRKNKATSELEF